MKIMQELSHRLRLVEITTSNTQLSKLPHEIATANWLILISLLFWNGLSPTVKDDFAVVWVEVCDPPIIILQSLHIHLWWMALFFFLDFIEAILCAASCPFKIHIG